MFANATDAATYTAWAATHDFMLGALLVSLVVGVVAVIAADAILAIRYR